MNKNIISLTVLTAVIALGSSVPAMALENDFGISIDGTVTTRSESSSSVEAGADSKFEKNIMSANNIDEGRSDNNKTAGEAQATTTGSLTADAHRSVVATFVQNLLLVANREGGIGSEVRVIAQEQNDSSSTTAKAVVEVENKGGFSTFLFGTDYKNIGVIRSELARTATRIDRLSALASSTSTSIIDRQQLGIQIEALRTDQDKLNAFVNANVGEFSIFGWFVRLFNN